MQNGHSPELHQDVLVHMPTIQAPRSSCLKRVSATTPGSSTNFQGEAPGMQRISRTRGRRHERHVQQAVAEAIQVLRFALFQQEAQLIRDGGTIAEKWQQYCSQNPQGYPESRGPSLSAWALCTTDLLDRGGRDAQALLDRGDLDAQPLLDGGSRDSQPFLDHGSICARDMLECRDFSTCDPRMCRSADGEGLSTHEYSVPLSSSNHKLSDDTLFRQDGCTALHSSNKNQQLLMSEQACHSMAHLDFSARDKLQPNIAGYCRDPHSEAFVFSPEHNLPVCTPSVSAHAAEDLDRHGAWLASGAGQLQPGAGRWSLEDNFAHLQRQICQNRLQPESHYLSQRMRSACVSSGFVPCYTLSAQARHSGCSAYAGLARVCALRTWDSPDVLSGKQGIPIGVHAQPSDRHCNGRLARRLVPFAPPSLLLRAILAKSPSGPSRCDRVPGS